MKTKLVALFLFMMVICSLKVSALENFQKGDEIRGAYVRIENQGKKMDLKVRFHYNSNNEVVYLLQPYSEEELTDFTESNIDEDQFKEMINIMYYGYGYERNIAQKWYVITQVKLWQEIYGEDNVYFIDNLNGNKVTKYTEEMEKLDELIKEHDLIPDFDKSSINYLQEDILTDKNNVLKKFAGENAIVKDNTLIVKAGITEDYHVTLVNEASKYSHLAMVYKNNDNYVIVPGNYETIVVNYDFSVNYGELKVNILDDDVYCEKCNEGMTYGIYNSNNDLVKEFNIKENEKIFLGPGNYTVKMLKKDIGYIKDENSYTVEIIKDTLSNLDINVYRIANIININKLNYRIEDNDSIFGLYDENGQEILTFKMNNGWYTFKLGYGDYVLKHLSNNNKYSIVDDIKLKVRTNELVQNKKIVSDLVDNVKIPDTLKLSSLFNACVFVIGNFMFKFGKY